MSEFHITPTRHNPPPYTSASPVGYPRSEFRTYGFALQTQFDPQPLGEHVVKFPTDDHISLVELASFHNRLLLVTCHGISHRYIPPQTSNNRRVYYRTQQPITSKERDHVRPRATPRKDHVTTPVVYNRCPQRESFLISLDSHYRRKKELAATPLLMGTKGNVVAINLIEQLLNIHLVFFCL